MSGLKQHNRVAAFISGEPGPAPIPSAEPPGANGDHKQPEKRASIPPSEPQGPPESASVNAYYDIMRKEFLIQNASGRWHAYDQGQFKLQLRARGYAAGKPPSGLVSPAEKEMLRIQNYSDVQYSGSLAGRKPGFYEENGFRILVTTGPKIMTADAVKWNLLEKIIRNVIASGSEPWAEDQWLVFNGWMKVARAALLSCKFQPGQALALAGEVDSGKSLLQAIITESLGGRSAKAAMYLQGRTDFNYDLFGAEHLMLEDESASTSHEARSALGAQIKANAVNRVHPCHQKRKDILNLCPWWRLSISLNNEAERMMILPRLSSDVADKIILLRAIRHALPISTESADEREAFWNRLMSELPGYLYWLEKEFKIPEAWASSRFGIKEFHHPELVEALDELSPAFALLELIDQLKPWGPASSEWGGTAAELRQLLLADDRLRRDATRLLSWTNACGAYLGEIAKSKPDRVKNDRTAERRNWMIFAP